MTDDDGIVINLRFWVPPPEPRYAIVIDLSGHIEAGRLCEECGEPFVRHGETVSTCLGGHSPPGHDHDPNAEMRDYYCAHGHMTPLARATTCPAPGCEYRGVRHNQRGSIRFVGEWPDIDSEETP